MGSAILIVVSAGMCPALSTKTCSFSAFTISRANDTARSGLFELVLMYQPSTPVSGFEGPFGPDGIGATARLSLSASLYPPDAHGPSTMRLILPALKSLARSSYLSYHFAPAAWRSWKYLYASPTPVVSATHLPLSSMSWPPKAAHQPNEW